MHPDQYVIGVQSLPHTKAASPLQLSSKQDECFYLEEHGFLARCFLIQSMTLDQNEKKLIEKLVVVLELLGTSPRDIKSIIGTKKVDADFLQRAGKFFDNTEACNVCSHAFYSWRNTVDDETVLSFIDDWINWKKQNKGSASQAPVIKMRKRS